MKRTMVMFGMMVLVGLPNLAKAQARGIGGIGPVRYRSGSYGYVDRGGWYNGGGYYYGRGGYYNGYYNGGYYYGHPKENVNVKYRERWDVQGGERSYEQSPKLEAKVIDAATILGALLIIFAH